MAGVKGAASKAARDWPREPAGRHRFDTQVADHAEDRVDGEVGENAPQGEGVAREDGDPESTEADHLARVKHEQGQGTDAIVMMMDPVNVTEDNGEVGDAMGD